MANKLQAYTQLSQETAARLTSNYQEWTAFLCTASRLYKYPFSDQMMIYDLWNKQMRRYVMRGAKGIALIDVSRDKARLRYVFDVSDTGELENARRPQLWQYRPEHRQAVAKALENRYGISDTDGFASQLERISSLLAAQYWEDH